MNTLNEELKQYKEFLSNNMYYYLDNLLNLKISTLSSKEIDDNNKKLLEQLNIYKSIRLYNMYNLSLQVLNENNINYEVFGNVDNLDLISIRLQEKNLNTKVLDYDFTKVRGTSYYNDKLNEFNLYVYKEAKEEKEQEINRVLEELEHLYDSAWNTSKEQKIRKYESLLEELDKKQLTDMDYQEIEITNKIYQDLKKIHDIDEKSMVDIYDLEDEGIFYNGKEKSCLNKVLVKKDNNTLIKSNIIYL